MVQKVDNWIGKSLNRYQIIKFLGEGGMSYVYLAKDTTLDIDVAVKILKIDELPVASKNRSLTRFQHEAQETAKLFHPNTVTVTDYGIIEEKPYLVMQYINGGNLQQLLEQRKRPIPYKEALNLIIPIAHALDYAHKRGIVHRDIKPANILLTENHKPMLTDFGIARMLEADQVTTEFSTMGFVVGTPEYMAPEQWANEMGDARSDIYSLGIVLYEMLTGQVPFSSEHIAGVMVQALQDLPKRPGEIVHSIPRSLDKVIGKALSRKPENRFQSMSEFIQMLEDVKANRKLNNKLFRNLEWKKFFSKKDKKIISFISLFIILLSLFTLSHSFSQEKYLSLFTLQKPDPTGKEMVINNNSTNQATSTLVSLYTQNQIGKLTNTPKITPSPRKTDTATLDPLIIGLNNIDKLDEIGRYSAGSNINQVLFSRDSSLLTFAPADTHVDILRVPDLSIFREFSGHTSNVTAVEISPDNKILITASKDYTVLLYGIDIGMQIGMMDDFGDWITHLSISSDGQTLAVFPSGKQMDLNGLTWIINITDPDSQYGQYAPENNIVAYTSQNAGGIYEVIFYNVTEKKQINAFRGHLESILCLDFSNDGTLIATGSKDNTVRVWDINDSNLVNVLSEHDNDVINVAFSADNDILASLSKDNKIRIWDVSKGMIIKVLTIYEKSITTIDFSSDGKYIAAGTLDGIIVIWGIQE